MKTFIAKSHGLLLGLAAGGLVALASPTAQAVIVPVSPVGQWDCVITGAGQQGIIFLNFTDDIDPISGFPTFEGIWVEAGHTGKLGNTNPSNPRGGGTG